MTNKGTVHFVSPNGGRDTISIIHGCVWTLILCAWSSLHPNVPANDNEGEVLLHRARWMLTTIIAPEYVAFHAIRDWYDAHWLLKQIRSIMLSRESDEKPGEQAKPCIGSIDGLLLSRPLAGAVIDEESIVGEKPDPLTLTKEHLDKLNGTQRRKESTGEGSDSTTAYGGVTLVSSTTQSRRTSSISMSPWTIEHAYYVCMGGFDLECPAGSTFRLDACQFLKLLELGVIELPDISAKYLRSESKLDVFAKAWACVQMFWLIAYLITRAAKQLPMTMLELFTAGEVSCTLMMYIGWWKKPKDIVAPRKILLNISRDGMEKITESIKMKGRANCHRVGTSDHIDQCTTKMKLFHWLVFALPVFLFSTCHLLGWHQYFPSDVERILWRISSIVCLVVPLTIVALGHLIHRLELKSLRYGNLVFFVLYSVFRMYMCAEMFAGLRQVPIGVYEDALWTSYIPHVGC